MRLYLDAVILIYTVERVEPCASALRARWERPGVRRVTSELSVLECRVRPLRFGQEVLLTRFERFFATGLDELLPVTREILERAAELRARYAFLKTPDTIRPATARMAGGDVFLTNDRRLDRCGGEIAVEVLAP